MTTTFRAGLIWMLIWLEAIVAAVFFIPSLGWSWKIVEATKDFFGYSPPDGKGWINDIAVSHNFPVP